MSFNVRGEPSVCMPEHAFRLLVGMSLTCNRRQLRAL